LPSFFESCFYVAGRDIPRNFLQMAEEEDDVTGFSNGDMGLQACALYDYQAGMLPKPRDFL
jgi:hypothetical protein